MSMRKLLVTLLIGCMSFCTLASTTSSQPFHFTYPGHLVKAEVLSSVENSNYPANLINTSLRIVYVYSGAPELLGKTCEVTHYKTHTSGIELPAFIPPLELGESGIWFVAGSPEKCYTNRELNQQMPFLKLPVREKDVHFSDVEEWAEKIEHVIMSKQKASRQEDAQTIAEPLKKDLQSNNPIIKDWAYSLQEEHMVNLDFICPGSLVKAEVISLSQKNDSCPMKHTLRILHVYKGNVSLLNGRTFQVMDERYCSYAKGESLVFHQPLQQRENGIWLIHQQFGEYEADASGMYSLGFLGLPAREQDTKFANTEQWAEAVEDVVNLLQQKGYAKDEQKKAIIWTKNFLKERYQTSDIPEIQNWLRYVVEDDSQVRIRHSSP